MAPPPRCQHQRDGRFHRGHISAEVHRHHPVPQIQLDVDDVGVTSERTHVGADVERRVDAAVGRVRRFRKARPPSPVRRGRRRRAVAVPPASAISSAVRRAPSTTTSPTTTVQPSCASRLLGGRTDSGRATRDDDDLAFQSAKSHTPHTISAPVTAGVVSQDSRPTALSAASTSIPARASSTTAPISGAR